MEEQNQVFHIPIDEYEKDIDTEFSRDKKNEIKELFTNHNQLRSKREYYEISKLLHFACRKGDLELIKISLSETFRDEINDLKFKINKTNKTASLYKICNRRIKELIVPRTVKHESDEYLITSIFLTGIFINKSIIKTIKFSEDSLVSTIYSISFSGLKMEEIYFPNSLKELKEGWCRDAYYLKKIIISLSNDQFIFKEDKYLVGKSDKNCDEFDILLFVNRDIKEFSIPTNIKIISSYAFSLSKMEEIFIPPNVSKICEGAFYECSNLKKVEIPTNSNLQTIGEKISIPTNVSKICEGAFSGCYDLKKVEIPTNSNLQTIERNAFSYSKIEEIYFPNSLKELKEGWCRDSYYLKKIIISPSNDQFIFKEDKYLAGKSDNQNEEFDILLFVNRDIKDFSIPTNIKIISSYAFSLSKIETISIPLNVSKICEGAFYECSNLKKVEIPTNSNLQTIEKNAFYKTKIEEIFIPTNVSKICEGAFFGCYDLKKVEIPKNSNLQTIERNAFSYLKIKKIFIPPNVSKICKDSFYNCQSLQIVEIPTNSNLQTIEINAFSYSKIEEIYFPNSLKELKEGWCRDAYYLKKIIISPSNDQFIFKEDKYLVGKSDKNCDEFDILHFVNRDIKEFSIPTNIKIISSYLFSGSKIEEIFISSNVSKICENAFSNCSNLKKVKIATNSKLQTIEREAFSYSKIEEIFIPPNVSKISECTFSNCSNLKKVKIATNSKLKTIEREAFSYSKIEEIFIPSNVSKIYKYAFYHCYNLKKVKIPINSNLQAIGGNAFSGSKIEEIFIPPNVSKISEDALFNCPNLQIVEISEESKLRSFSQFVFSSCSKVIIMIPSSLKINFT